MNSICGLFACAEPFLSKATCVSSSQMQGLLVSLELAMIEIKVESNVTAEMVSP